MRRLNSSKIINKAEGYYNILKNQSVTRDKGVNMIKKIYDFLKNVLKELDENDTSTTMDQKFFMSNDSENLNHKVDIEQPLDEVINPVNGILSNNGWDINGNPNGTSFHSATNDYSDSFGNSFNSDFGSSFNDDFHNN